MSPFKDIIIIVCNLFAIVSLYIVRCNDPNYPKTKIKIHRNVAGRDIGPGDRRRVNRAKALQSLNVEQLLQL